MLPYLGGLLIPSKKLTIPSGICGVCMCLHVFAVFTHHLYDEKTYCQNPSRH